MSLMYMELISSRSVSGADDVAVAICSVGSGVCIRVATVLETNGAMGAKAKVFVVMERNAGIAIKLFIVYCDVMIAVCIKRI